MPELTLLKWLLALSPIVVVLVLMIGFKWGGGRAGAAGWLSAFLVGSLFFGATPKLLALAQTKGVLLSLYVLFIVWMALALYNVVSETGAIEVIGDGIRRLTDHKPLQLLILGWVFASFLQGVAGFGVPIAVVGPLLLGLGFAPPVAVAVPAIGHSWSVTFGDMASSFQAMIAVTSLEGAFLAHWSALLLGVTVYLCGLAVVHFYGGLAGLRQGLLPIVLIGTVMAATQYLLAVAGLWTLAGFVAGIAGLAASALVTRLPAYRGAGGGAMGKAQSGAPLSITWALAAYLVLVAVATVAEVVEPVHHLLNQVKLSLMFPEIKSAQGWLVKAGYGKKISIFGHAGAILSYCSLIGYLIYRAKGFYRPGALGRIVKATINSGVPTSIGIVSMVCMALIMDHCGMTYLLAEGASRALGKLYPLFSSAIGTLGAFMTGSNTNSNVVFGMFQKQTAQIAGLAVAVILGAQTTGGSIGSMLAPAKILVGCSTVGLAGKEGPVLAATVKYGALITLIIGLLALLLAGAGN